jgi:hypothetical protein
VRIRIEGSDLPGRRGGIEADALRRNHVQIGVQRRAEVVDPVSARRGVGGGVVRCRPDQHAAAVTDRECRRVPVAHCQRSQFPGRRICRLSGRQRKFTWLERRRPDLCSTHRQRTLKDPCRVGVLPRRVDVIDQEQRHQPLSVMLADSPAHDDLSTMDQQPS